jgi:membrane protein implicated in regulation of membrane protease activity
VSRPTTKRDVEIEKLHLDHRFRMLIAGGIFVIFCILSAALPLYVIGWAAVQFAGTETAWSISILAQASVVLNAGCITTAITLWVKYRGRKQEVVRLRERCVGLEQQLKEQAA